MKKYSILFCLFLQLAMAFAQAPEKMSYQAVVRNNNNVLVSNHAVGMRISILQGSATGTAVYTETQTPTTNANGLIAIEIGTGTLVTGTFANIDWANGPFFVKTETDPNGGSNYTLTASNQLLSVPYALYAKTAGNVGSGLPSGAVSGQSLTFCDGQYIWGQCQAKVSSLFCIDSIQVETLNISSQGNIINVNYTGGNGGVYQSQSITSTGISGLIVSLTQGTLNNGNGLLNLLVKGTPNSNGTAIFNLNLGGKICQIKKVVRSGFSNSTVFCNSTKTEIIDVTNPITGRTWMDRNLGASRAANSITDTFAYGDLYQWGRGADGHQCRNSGTQLSIKSTTDQPGHSLFIISPYYGNSIDYGDWREPQNSNLWQGVNGINNPCPNGYRVPTKSEFMDEKNSWNQNNQIGSFNSPLKLISSGYRTGHAGNPGGQIYLGSAYYWTSTIYIDTVYFSPVQNSVSLYFDGSNSFFNANGRYMGLSIRCIKN
jgi:uncharacterized protein (TIGR02145 family)